MSKKLNPRNLCMIVITVIFFAFQMYLALIKQLTPMLQSPLHLVFALAVYISIILSIKLIRKR